MFLLLCLIVSGPTYKVMSFCPSSITNKYLIHYGLSGTDLSPTHGVGPDLQFSTPTEWAHWGRGLNIGNEVEVSSGVSLDFTGLTKFSFEVWYWPATKGVVAGLRDRRPSRITKSGCPSSLLSLNAAGRNHIGMNYNALDVSQCRTSNGKNSFTQPLYDEPLNIAWDVTLKYEQMHHAVITVDNNGIFFGSPATVPSVTTIYIDGVKSTNPFGTLGGNFEIQPTFVVTGWDEVDIVLGGSYEGDMFQGEIYKVAVYNTVLSDVEVTEVYDQCLPNSKPFAPDIIVHIPEDTRGTITLNGGKQTSLTEPIDDTPYQLIYFLDQVMKITGNNEAYGTGNLGTRIYDLEGGFGANYFTYQIIDLPSFSIFELTTSTTTETITEDFTVPNHGGPLTLDYQAVLNEQSWLYRLNPSGWNVLANATSFQYRVSDGIEFSDPAIVTIVVDPLSDVPAAEHLEASIPAGTFKIIHIPTIQLASSEDFVGLSQGNNNINRIIVTAPLPTKGTLSYCPADTCTSGCNWINVTSDTILPPAWSQSADVPPCLKYTAFLISDAPESGVDLLDQDSIEYKVCYGNDNDPKFLFNEANRCGLVGSITISITNPFNARGNAPFESSEVCILVEDEKTIFEIDYVKPSTYSGEIRLIIHPLPPKFLGTLYIDDVPIDGTQDELIFPEGVGKNVMSYLPPTDRFTTFHELDPPTEDGFNFNFSVQATINGVEFLSVVGTQHLCVEARNDAPIIHSVQFYSPVDCCTAADCVQDIATSTLEWATQNVENGNTNGSVSASDPRQTFKFENLKCSLFKIEWSDPDEPSDNGNLQSRKLAEYEIKLQTIYKETLEKTPGNLAFWFPDGMSNDVTIGGSNDGRQVDPLQLIGTYDALTFGDGLFKCKKRVSTIQSGNVIFDLAIRDKSIVTKQDPEVLSTVTFQKIIFSDISSDAANAGLDGCFISDGGLCLSAVHVVVLIFSSLGGCILLCIGCCCCSYRMQEKRIKKKYNANQGALYGQPKTQVDLRTMTGASGNQGGAGYSGGQPESVFKKYLCCCCKKKSSSNNYSGASQGVASLKKM